MTQKKPLNLDTQTKRKEKNIMRKNEVLLASPIKMKLKLLQINQVYYLRLL
jgi:hypothetical protein